MSANQTLTEQDVVEFLTSHPDFFINKDELLSTLRIPHASGQATSLIERQLGIYRERNVSLRQQLSDLLENARRNDELFHKSRRLMMTLLEANNWLEVQTVLDDGLRSEFMVENWALMHITDRTLEKPLHTISMSDFKNKVQRIFRGHRSVCGTFAEQDINILFSHQELDAKSIATTQIRGKGHIGVLSISSTNPNRYRQNTDTLFLDYVGDVLSLILPQLPVS